MQVDELRSRIRELEERDRRESKKIADEDALRRIRQAEEQIEHLQRKLGATKQVKCPVVSLLLSAGIPLALCHVPLARGILMVWAHAVFLGVPQQ